MLMKTKLLKKLRRKFKNSLRIKCGEFNNKGIYAYWLETNLDTGSLTRFREVKNCTWFPNEREKFWLCETCRRCKYQNENNSIDGIIAFSKCYIEHLVSEYVQEARKKELIENANKELNNI